MQINNPTDAVATRIRVVSVKHLRQPEDLPDVSPLRWYRPDGRRPLVVRVLWCPSDGSCYVGAVHDHETLLPPTRPGRPASLRPFVKGYYFPTEGALVTTPHYNPRHVADWWDERHQALDEFARACFADLLRPTLPANTSYMALDVRTVWQSFCVLFIEEERTL